MSNETAKTIDQEIRKIVEAGYDRATKMLTEKLDQLHLLANALLEYETLSGDEIKTLLDKGEIVREDGTTIEADSIPVVGTSIPRTGRKRGGGIGSASPAGA